MANKAFGVSNINATGSVGIGTNNPLVPLHISGTNGLIVEDSTNQKLGDLRCKNDIVELNAYDPANSNAAVPIVFKQYTSERVRIASDGKVGIGNTDPEGILTLGSFTGGSQLIRMRTSSAQVLGLDMGGSSDPDAGRVRYYLTDDTLRFFTESTHRATIDSDGLKFSTDTAAANALNDYEEGTHVPTITLGSGSINTNHSDTLSYVKVGRLVHVQGRIHLTLSATDVSSFTFTLPFANCTSLSENAEDSSSVTHVIRATTAGTNVDGIRFFRLTGNTATVSMQNPDGANTGNFGVNNPHINVNLQYRST